ncbi:type IV-A pilus assembly ATPase PilB [Candidatus Macondimonas diazotrophica]|uniref:Type IV-A pilus assembly ATPase PilB n=1 Tax=Candidatus Macondimonas diazotrophica TaxID=2305248 RepID=A0A4Z0FAC9_9GAMM|nr:type IV-A pilus assembly ATPase PilB [Candidatus Macondimonas diazotrophica]TFZ83389.1 type IV-A pilus assembly ATPase PilB [Candidatus Macondimonas diazotrophica]
MSGLARRLVQSGLLTDEAALRALEEAAASRQALVVYLYEHKLVGERELARMVAEEFGTPVIDLTALDLRNMPMRLVDEKLLRRHQVLPIFVRGHRLYVAMSDPTNQQALDDIAFATRKQAVGLISEHTQLLEMLDKALDAHDARLTALADADLEKLDVQGGDAAASVTEPDVDDAPVVRFINKILLDAVNKGASDIHFEPYEQFYRIRRRQDGILYDINRPPVTLGMRLAARLKVMARLDIAERRVPQDGRIKLKLSKQRAIDFRVSTCPTLWGEKIVLRILDATSAQIGIDSLGFEPHQKAIYLKTLSKPQGMILVTGPTGSGKTVTLYTGLNILNTTDRNISTAEDPVEINLPGINQVNVNPRIGLDFANSLRAFLRQDPDVIMVGEIRDLETAEIAIKAAQTGHMVLSTLHTNDAPQSLERLINMGVAPFNIASSVHLIIAQRLARRLCRHCRTRMEVPRDALLQLGFLPEELDELVIYGPKGCEHCTDGYKGRVGIYQVLPVSPAIGRIIMDGGNSLDIAKQAAEEGVIDLRRAGLNKVKEGLTGLEEIHRVTID